MTNDPPEGQNDAQAVTPGTRCTDWLDEEHSLSDGKPVFVRCDRQAGHEGDHGHGRFGWGVNGWSEELTREITDEIARLSDDIDGGDE